MGNGWICLHRSIIDNWVFSDPVALKAWLCILLSANHKETKVLFDGELIPVQKGQFITSVRKFADKVGCTRRKAEKLLELFELDNMIHRTRHKKGTLLTVEKYSIYQDMRDSESTSQSTGESTTQSTGESTQTTMKNNENNENKEREGELPPVTVKRFPAGKYQNVFLSQEEAVKLQKEFPNEAAAMIETLSEYMETSGKSYKNHFAVIAKWIREDRKNPKKKQKEDAIDAKQRANYGEHWTDHIFDT